MRKKHEYRHRLNRRGRAAILLLFAFFLGIFLYVRYVPVLRASAENEAKRWCVSAMNRTVNEVIQEQNMDFSTSLLENTTQTEGFSANMTEINLLKEAVTLGILEELNGTVKITSVPLGTLLGNEWVYGLGPQMPLRVTLAGNVLVDFESEFTSAGINQTKYLLYLTVHTSVYTFLPGVRGATEVQTKIPVAETVLIGDVPQFYANVGDLVKGN